VSKVTLVSSTKSVSIHSALFSGLRDKIAIAEGNVPMMSIGD
jgi:hypothetical protein